MKREEFKEKVQQELKKLDRDQTVHFAWRCAVRALPFLGSNGNFNFWNKKDRQKYIYAVFYALDFNAYAAVAYAADAYTAAAAAYAADAYAVAAAAYAYAAAYAVDATADAADATAVAGYAVDSAAYAVAANKNMNLEPIILQDLNTIQNKRWAAQHKLTDLYGEIWDNFQKALESEGCAYWGQLYKRIFDSGFVLDPEALERRINVPKEIRENGAAAVANYLEELEKGATRLNEARIIILGDKGAGKTCIARRLIDPEAPMTTDDESTAGVNTMIWKLDDENINVRIWDFAGHTVTHAVHQFFLSERCLYLMVYDGRTEERNRLEYWLDHMKNYGGDSKAIILVNKRDQHSVDIPINSLKEQYSIEGFYTFSIKDDETDLMAFRNDVSEYIRNNPSWKKQEIPVNYYKVKDELENLFEKGKKEICREHITRDEFDEIAGRHDVENTEELLEDLHFLGVSLLYKDMEEIDTLVLNPEWISHGVYKIINWVNEEKKHSLTSDDFTTVFKEDANRYPENKHKFLFKLMIRYELAYETAKGEKLIIPHLLKEDRPAEIPDFPMGESLMLRYKAEQPLPPNTISRFIVRHNHEIKKEKNSLEWRYGVVLEDGNGSIALVREEDRTISVSVKGKDKTNYISTLRDTLNDIFNSYKSEKPELQYRIERLGQILDELEAKNPLWLPDTKIINHHKREKPYYDDATDLNIPMASVVNIYKIEAENVISGGQGNKIVKNSIDFRDNNISLQGNLNELGQVVNLLKGFEDYAKLKGYSISFSVEKSITYEVAFKLTINESDINIGTNIVRKDIIEYIDKVKTGDDLNNMPEILDPMEHELILTTLKNQISLLRHNNELQQNAVEFYESFMKRFNATNPSVPSQHSIVVQTGELNQSQSSLANNSPDTILGQNIDNSINTTFNFRDCNIGLQGNLNELAQLLTEGGNKEEAKELKNAANALKSAKDSVNQEEVIESGIVGRLKGLVEDLENKDSNLYEIVEGVKKGISIAQKIAKKYNDIAQWAALPQVPKPFLK